MKQATSPLRIFRIARFFYPIIFVGAVLTTLGSLFIAYFTPYSYRSEGIVQIKSSRSVPLGPGDVMGGTPENTDLIKAVTLLRSPLVMLDVAEELKKSNIDLTIAFPKSLSAFDFNQRLVVLSKQWYRSGFHSYDKNDPSSLGKVASAELIASLLANHLRAEPDYTLQTIKLVYEAGSPALAQIICDRITKNFVKYLVAHEQEELQNLEKYLETSIQNQLQQTRALEGRMREIVERYPQMTSSKEEQKGATLFALRYIEKQEMLKRLDLQLEDNGRLLKDIRRDLASGKGHSTDNNEQVSNKIASQIADLEYKLLQYTTVSGYDESHPQIQALKQRIEGLKGSLAGMGRAPSSLKGLTSQEMSNVEEKNYKSLYQTTIELREKNRRLMIERDTIRRDLARHEASFKEVVKVNFSFDSLARDLNTNVSVTNDLYRELQKTRLSMAAVTGASVLSPANLSIYATNISVSKRGVFGFFVGIAWVLSLLFLLEMLNPRLLLLEDLETLEIGSFGVFRIQKKALAQVAYWIMSLKDKPKPHPGARTVALFRLGSLASPEKCLDAIAERLAEHGERLGLLVIEDELKATSFASSFGGRENDIVRMASESVPFDFARVTGEMRSRYDWIFVVLPDSSNVPIETFIGRSVDNFLYFCEFGVSDLKRLKKIKAVSGDAQVAHHAIVFQR